MCIGQGRYMRPCEDIRSRLGIRTRKTQVVARELPGRESRVEKGAGCTEGGLLCPASHLGDDLSLGTSLWKPRGCHFKSVL